jgi:hypothetical protein
MRRSSSARAVDSLGDAIGASVGDWAAEINTTAQSALSMERDGNGKPLPRRDYHADKPPSVRTRETSRGRATTPDGLHPVINAPHHDPPASLTPVAAATATQLPTRIAAFPELDAAALIARREPHILCPGDT